MQRPLKNSSLPRLKMHHGWVERRAFDDFHAAPWSSEIKNALVSRENANRRGLDWANYYATTKICAPVVMLRIPSFIAPFDVDVSVVGEEPFRDTVERKGIRCLLNDQRLSWQNREAILR